MLTSLCKDDSYKLVFSNISVRTMPLNHGSTILGHYESAAFFIRHDSTSREFLFFGDVEPDTIAATPQTINVWSYAAPKIPETLSVIFIECSWPSGRDDEHLYGHLTPEHLVDELTVLAVEVVKAQKSKNGDSRPVRKKQKQSTPSREELRGSLHGLRIYLIHCKDDMTLNADRLARDIIFEQVKALVEKKNLGAEILVAKQGIRIGV